MNILDSKDISNIIRYSKHYNVEIPSDLNDALTNLEKDHNESNEIKLKIQLCIWLTTDNHFLNDSMWAAPVKAAKEFLEVENVSK